MKFEVLTKQHSWNLSLNGHVEPGKLVMSRVFLLPFLDSGSGALRVSLYFCAFFQIAPPKKTPNQHVLLVDQ